MPSFHAFLLFSFFLALSVPHGSLGGGRSTFRFDLHHRFSDHVKRWAAHRPGIGFRPEEWPEKGSVDYYAALAHQDRILRNRRLTEERPLTFSDGNATFQISTLGFLHYTTVSLGTPSVTFLVALDTGSDLFWVPCDCVQCAPTSSSTYGFSQNFELSIFSPNTSLTSKTVPCNNSLCEARNECSGAAKSCPYNVAYVSANTSSSGVLVEDVMYLTAEDGQQDVVDARVIFGCGKVQSGSFLDVAAPNGLFGLGMEKISVPSILSAAGLTANSFSMCFGSDGIGRIIFGDKGSSDQDETPFNLGQSHPTYNVSVTGLHVGTTTFGTSFSAVFDSGTSFTYLADPAYTRLYESFNSQVQDKQYSPDSGIPFKYCYSMSSNESTSSVPSISFTMNGGGKFSVFDPIIVFSSQKDTFYCLAVVKSNNLNIIGQNFMTGQRIVFDRENLVLGWKKFDCYNVDNSSTLSVNTTNNAKSPTTAVKPDSYTPEATTQRGNESQVSVLPVPPLMSSSSWTHSRFIYSCLILFSVSWVFFENSFFYFSA